MSPARAETTIERPADRRRSGRGPSGGAWIIGIPLLWLMVFLVVPFGLIVLVSFLSRGAYGELEWTLTVGNYRRLLGFGALGFDPIYLGILGRSLLLAAGTVTGCVALGLPLAFFIGRLSAPYKSLALTLVVIPFWTNLLIRTYAWQILLGPSSFLSTVAVSLGWLPEGQGIYPGTLAVQIGMICDFLPFLVLPLYASVEKIDWTLVEAAQDLGANRRRAFRHAVLPQITPGLAAGAVLVFLPALGQFVIPDLLGGAKTVLLGNLVEQQFHTSRDWPFGAAATVVALVLVAVGLGAYRRLARAPETPLI